jgi:hypothetical protein
LNTLQKWNKNLKKWKLKTFFNNCLGTLSIRHLPWKWSVPCPLSIALKS